MNNKSNHIRAVMLLGDDDDGDPVAKGMGWWNDGRRD